MNDLVVLHKKQTVTSSRKVAEVFEKEHGKVIRSIENLTEAKNGLSGTFFFATTYKDSSGKSNKEYLMNRDGFSLLVMGFTGEKALEFKLKYIEAFNRMEAEQNKPKLNKITSVSSVVNDVYRLSKTMSKMFPAMPDSIALTASFEQVETTRGIDLGIIKALIPADTTEAPSFTLKAKDIAIKADIRFKNGKEGNTQEVNKRLADKGLQEKQGDEWHVTEAGKEYGAEFPFTRNGHSGFEIRWSAKVINLVTKKA